MEDELDLAPEQLIALREVERWRCTALAEVGTAYLEDAAARSAAAAAADRLQRASEQANHAIAQYQRVFAAMIDLSHLPDGEWTLDIERGKLVRRKTP